MYGQTQVKFFLLIQFPILEDYPTKQNIAIKYLLVVLTILADIPVKTFY